MTPPAPLPGEPFTVPEELGEQYARGGEEKHEATARLMQRVEAALGTVTISAADYETLEFFWCGLGLGLGLELGLGSGFRSGLGSGLGFG